MTFLEVRLRFSFVPLYEYKGKYGCVVFGVGKLSHYPTSIINGKRKFYLEMSLVTVFQLLAENANGINYCTCLTIINAKVCL